ncbi:TIM-barrel domain-containing protein [Enterococcus sp. JM9B]|uniref:TIM-barrel domain-containing protein n=1 Tax=Enterococcus sp. JM9B TaxID=1857216 RepID=UPI0013751017|nr:TIM-barrel domain-containing protein [Enterococcus sp. JM9B]KAF1303137.1 hypothetical protein BAU16_05530 [Enterococcus sp. JM9B]
MEIYLKDNHYFSIKKYSENTLRIQIQPTIYGLLDEPLMNRLELLTEPKIMESPEISEKESDILYVWQGLSFKINSKTLAFEVVANKKRSPFLGQVQFTKTQVSCRMQVKASEKFMGLGYRKIDQLNLRGKVYRNHVTYGAAYGPQPFLYSNQGFGVYLNTTKDSFFDICSRDYDTLSMTAPEKSLDIFLFFGDPKSILDSYTSLTGRPYLMPETGYGLMFIGNEKETQFDILNDVEHFLKEEISCQYIGLEPGWMETHYDVTVDKAWNKERFFMPYWSEDRKQFQKETFIGAMKRKGFGLSLWLCCDYDIFWAEQNHLKVGEDLSEEIEFNEKDFDLRAHTPIYMDRITKKEEPWFDHLKKFIDDGVTAFKQDPAFICNDHPDRLYAGQFTDKEVHNVYATVLARQVHEGYKRYTGMRPMHYTGVGYTGIQRWAPSWTCDCGGREEALMGVLLSGLCGHMNMTCDLDITTLDGLHFGFLLPWSQINSWASLLQPWYLDSKQYEAFRYYAALHDQLFPYIYSFARQGHDTGMPIVRAMPLCYPDDENAYQANRQYLLGDSLLVGCFTNKIYLPTGLWYNFWTNEAYKGEQWVEAKWPSNRGGALFVKEGAIIPLRGKDANEIICRIYPGNGEFFLYEDDGISFDYEDGTFSKRKITSTYHDGNCQMYLYKDQNVEASTFQKKRIVAETADTHRNIKVQED